MANSAFSVSGTTSGTGSYLLLSSQIASNSPTIEFDNLSAAYNEYKIFIDYFMPVTTSTNLLMRLSSNNGSSFDATSLYYWNFESLVMAASPTPSYVGAQADTAINIVQNINSPGNHSIELTIFNPSVSTNTMFYWDGIYSSGSFNYKLSGSALYNNTVAVNALQFLMNSGNILSGTFNLYGILA